MTENQSIHKMLLIILAVALMLTLLPGITLAADTPVNINGMLSVSDIQTAIQSAITLSNPGDTVTVTGLFSSAGTTLTLDIPANVKVEWGAGLYVGSASPLVNLKGDGTFEVGGAGGAWLENTGIGNTINTVGNNAVVIVNTGGVVSASSGSAIDASGLNAVVIIQNGGTALNDATTNIRPVIHMSNLAGFGTKVVIDSGSVSAMNLNSLDYAIQTYGDVEIKGNSKVYADPGNGRAVNALGPTSNVTISDNAKVWAVSGIAIRTNSAGATITVKDSASVYNEGANDNYPVIYMENGGILTVQDNGKVEAKSSGTAIKTYGDVIVTDNGWVTATTGQAIHTIGGSSSTTVNGGLVFAYGRGITGTGNVTSSAPTVNNPGMVIAWNSSSPGPFTAGLSEDLVFLPMSSTCVWAIEGGVSGVRYTNGANTGFYPINVTLNVLSVPVTQVNLNPTTMTLIEGNYGYISAIITPSTATNQIITWDSDNISVATISFDGTGNVVTGIFPGTANITVTTADGSHTATCLVTVTAAPVITASAGSGGNISPSGAVSVAYNTAMGDYGDQNFTITADPGYDIFSVAVDGLNVSIASAVGGTFTYSFLNVSTGHTIQATFTGSPVPVTQVDLNPTTMTLIEGDSDYLYVTFTPSNPTNQVISWSSDDPSVATISSDGVNHVVTGVSSGTANITVTTADGSYTSTCLVTVLVPPVITASAGSGGSISPSGAVSVAYNTTIGNYGDQNFTITANPGYVILSVAVDGVNVSLASAVGGTFVYSFSAVNTDHTIHATFAVPVTQVTLNPTTLTLVESEWDELYVTITPSSATNKNITWSSDDVSVATISSNGTNHTVTGISPGTANITVTTEDGSYTATCLVTVTATPVITASAGLGGIISPSGAVFVAYNTTIRNYGDTNFTITANPGYDILSVAVDGGNVSLASAVGGIFVYSFSTVSADHTIHATFVRNSTAGGGGSGSGSGSATVVPPGNVSSGNTSSQNNSGGNNSPSNSDKPYIVYPVIRQLGQYFNSGSSEGIIDAPFDEFIRLVYKGQVVDPNNYTVTRGNGSSYGNHTVIYGNTLITLKESYVQTFDAGEYTFHAEFTHGYSDLTLVVEDDDSGLDDSVKKIVRWWWVLLLLLLLLIILIILYIYWKRRQASS